MIITVLLIFSCITVPVQMALMDDLTLFWMVSNYVIDILFFIDIFVIFNTAIYDDDFVIVEDRTVIAKDYLCGWFIIDLTAILPLELMIDNG